MGLDELKTTFAEAKRLAEIAHDAATQAAALVDDLGSRLDVTADEVKAARAVLKDSEDDLSRALEVYTQASADFGLLIRDVACEVG